MRVLILQDHLRNGGTERQSVLLANELAATGAAGGAGAGNATGGETIAAGLLTFRPGGALDATVSPAVTRRALQPFDTRLDWFAPGLRRAVRRFAPDILLCMGRMANCRAAGLVRAFPALPVVATMRTGKALPWLYRRGLRAAGAVVANSAHAARALTADLAIPPEKITVIANAPVFAPDSVPPSPLPASRSPLPAATPAILCCAMFRPEKGHAALLEAAALLPRDPNHRWRLVLAGDGPALPECRALARKLGIAERVEFAGFVADPRPLYRAAAVAVLASRSESLPNFLVEAHLHGVPSVAFATGGVAECGGETVTAGDVPALSRALAALLFDPERRAAAGEAVAAFSRARFSRAAQLAAYLRLFGRLKEEG
ncbi:MAG: glycosyltransferase [Puniceicoccales bacterium]|jgi:glycosyltransferase involved in cell wall biosynthesis|nr:glycosyltransferase [Puniceicoccales bacterium]